MSATFDDLRVLQISESIADSIWKAVTAWDKFAKDVVGKQLARAADSMGANIAESFGRFSYGEKIQFLYYARGSLFETKYWLNRSRARNLFESKEVDVYALQLTDLARQLNALSRSLKSLRYNEPSKPKTVKEDSEGYLVQASVETSDSLFTESDLAWLSS